MHNVLRDSVRDAALIRSPVTRTPGCCAAERAQAAASPASGGLAHETRRGTQCSDHLVGTPLVDNLLGWRGRDTLFGEEVDDYVDGSDGNDVLHGDGGADKVFGRFGNDRIFGEQATTSSKAAAGATGCTAVPAPIP